VKLATGPIQLTSAGGFSALAHFVHCCAVHARDVCLSVCVCVVVKARRVLQSLLDVDDDVDVEFNLIKNALQQEQVCSSFSVA